MLTFQDRRYARLGQGDGIGKYVLGRGVKHVVLNLDENGADQTR